MTDPKLEQHIETLREVRDLLAASPEFQGKQYDSIGIDFNAAIAYFAALSQQRAVPEGYALVRKRIHPLDTDKGEPVIQLLANSPDAKPFNDPNDYYAHWWGLLCDAAPSPEQEK